MLQTLLGGTAHKLTADLKTALMADNKALIAWQSLTPLARNEWICWVTFPKQAKTRTDHVKRVITELKDGIRRPCCWIGCTHRQDKTVSKSVKWLMKRQSKSK